MTYINHDKQERQCTNCKEIKPFGYFSFINGRPRPQCKACKTEIEMANRTEKLLAAEPHRFVECQADDCTKVYGKRYKQCIECGAPNENSYYSNDTVTHYGSYRARPIRNQKFRMEGVW